jgi:hypothetical protein
MTTLQLQQRVRRARRKTQLLQIAVQEAQVEARQVCRALQRQRYEGRERRECERLRHLMPEANPWTIELTAQILVARGLDAGLRKAVSTCQPHGLAS